MELLDHLKFFTSLDALAVGYLLLAWFGIGYVIERPLGSRISTSVLVANYRKQWMIQMITRQPRIFDATILFSGGNTPSVRLVSSLARTKVA